MSPATLSCACADGGRRRRRGVALALLLAIGLAAAAPRAEAAPDERRRRGAAALVERHAAELGLDEETRAAIEAVVADAEARSRALREELRAARGRIHDLLSEPEADRAAVMAEADAIGRLQGALHRNRLDAVLRIHALLTPEQRETLVRLRAERGFGRRHERGPLGRCDRDRRALCGDAPDGPAVLRCLAARWDEVSERCRAALEQRDPAAAESASPDRGRPPG